jgi:DNA repair ATPase RecN
MKDRQLAELEQKVKDAQETANFKYDTGIAHQIERAERELEQARKNLSDYKQSHNASDNRLNRIASRVALSCLRG